ncbi:hypothetical protein N665_0480s0004 [Sinapis alba]|nr:hypothetical protein N665_0480s0004 [Sinapis alba]
MEAFERRKRGGSVFSFFSSRKWSKMSISLLLDSKSNQRLLAYSRTNLIGGQSPSRRGTTSTPSLQLEDESKKRWLCWWTRNQIIGASLPRAQSNHWWLSSSTVNDIIVVPPPRRRFIRMAKARNFFVNMESIFYRRDNQDDVVLISSWLNTSKDPLVGNEQLSDSFWKRIAAYFAASPKIGVGEHMEHDNCKQRWHRINDLVSKLCGAYEAATRERSIKLAHEIFFNSYKKKFTLEHAWKELRHDHKWCDLSSSKTERNSKKRKCDEGAQSSTSLTFETNTGEADVATNRPPGVKAAKGHGKKTKAEGKALAEFHGLWDIKKEDMVMEAKLTKMKLLDRLIAKPEPLAEVEEALKNKLINE